MRSCFWRGLTLFFALVAASGCQPGAGGDENVPPPTSRDQAAAVLISADVAAPWDDVANAMQPKFDLPNGDAALAKGVIPTTAEMQQQVLESFALAGSIHTPGAGSQSSQSSSSTAPVTLPPIPKPSGTIGVDPSLQYQVALALYQQVKLMNAQVHNIARDERSVPYLVQLRLTVMPYRRQLPYDLHVRLSFFAYRAEGNDDSPYLKDMLTCMSRNGAKYHSPSFPHVMPLLATDDLERTLTSEAAESARQYGFGLAAAIHGFGATLQANQLGEILKAIEGQGVNSLFTVGRLSDNTIYVRIGAANQPSGKTEKPDNFAVVGKNYDVSLLLLVPITYFACLKENEPDTDAGNGDTIQPVIDIVGDTGFRKASEGSSLADRPRSAFVAQLDRAFPSDPKELSDAWAATSDEKKRIIGDSLLFGVEDNDYGEFTKTLGEICLPKDGSADRGLSFVPDQPCANPKTSAADVIADPDLLTDFWNKLSGALGDFKQLQATLTLPWPKPVVVPSQTALLVDDGKTGAQIQLSNVSGPADHLLAATLYLKGVGKSAQTYPFAARSLALDQTTSVLTIGFASPSKLGLTKIDTTDSRLELKYKGLAPCDARNGPAAVNLYCRQGALRADGHDNRFRLVALHASASENKEPGLSFSAKTDTVVAVRGEAKLTVTVDKLKDASAKITVAGAQYSGAVDGAGKTLVGPNQDIVVKKNTVITYALQNLNAGSTFSVTAEGRDAAGKSTGSHVLKFTVAK